jgi:5'-3' exoribonuclease 1
MPNDFPARERAFISQLAAELYLDVKWDEYDDEDQNLIIIRLPNWSGAENGSNTNEGDAESDDEDENWVDESDEEDEEANEAVDRVLKKYEKAEVVEEEEEDFDTRHERNVQEKMDEWKRGYYRVSEHCFKMKFHSLMRFLGQTGAVV